LFQDFGRYHFMVKENITLGDTQTKDTISDLEKAIRKAELTGFVDTLPDGVDTQLGKQFGGTELSGGQWQKVALARAFYRKGDILILDEPSSSLDPEAEYALFNRLSELSQGRLTLFITHRLSSVRMADRILVLQKGKLIEDGSHHELLQKGGPYARLYQMQASQFGA
jgi:ABC-type multidrug transport system fused ATPase/permease subunit